MNGENRANNFSYFNCRRVSFVLLSQLKLYVYIFVAHLWLLFVSNKKQGKTNRVIDVR